MVTGTRIKMARSAPRTLMPATVHEPLNAVGKWADESEGCGISIAMAWARPAMPMVATSTTTRGAFFNRRMTVSSTAATDEGGVVRRAGSSERPGHRPLVF